MKNFTYIDLFAGAGGLSLGFGNAGFDLEFANDIAGEALNTFRYNLKKTHPGLPKERIIHGDITQLYEQLGNGRVVNKSLGHITVETEKERRLRKNVPDTSKDESIRKTLCGIQSVDVLAGGPPCQGFSMIGRSKRATLQERMLGFVDDPRNQLFLYFLKFAEKLNPKIVLIENVKGLGSAAAYRDLIEASLKKTGYGYDVASRVLNAKDFGLAQHRERLFFVGIRKDLIKAEKEFTSETFFENLDKQKSNKISLNEVLGDLPLVKANPKPSNYSPEAEVSFNNPESFGMNVSSKEYSKLVKSGAYTEKINTYRGNLIEPLYLYNHKARFHNERDLFIYKNLVAGKYLNNPVNKVALSRVSYGVTTDEKGNKSVNGFGDKYFKLDPNGVSKTIIAHLETDGNSYVHPGKHPRSITPREAARIQSFPDWYEFRGSTRNQFKQIGNAVPPLLAFKVAINLKRILIESERLEALEKEKITI